MTVSPGEMSQANIDQLLGIGLSDQQITIATQVIGYFNYINRIADGLGVDLEDWMTVSQDQWQETKPNWAKV